jgi:hypothetical protein
MTQRSTAQEGSMAPVNQAELKDFIIEFYKQADGSAPLV